MKKINGAYKILRFVIIITSQIIDWLILEEWGQKYDNSCQTQRSPDPDRGVKGQERPEVPGETAEDEGLTPVQEDQELPVNPNTSLVLFSPIDQIIDLMPYAGI